MKPELSLKKKNLLALFIALFPFAFLAAIWPSLPDNVPLHYDYALQPNRFGSKTELLWSIGLLSFVSYGCYLLLTYVKRIDSNRQGLPSLAMGLVVFFALLSLVIIYTTGKDALTLKRLLFPLLGVFFAFLGYSMSRLQPNYAAGFRLKWTLKSTTNWTQTHRLGGKLWLVGGLILAIGSLAMPAGFAFFFFLGITCVLTLMPIIYSYRLSKKED